MLIKFFRNSNPINIGTIVLLSAILYFTINFYSPGSNANSDNVLEGMALFLSFCGATLILNTIGHQNYTKYKGLLIPFCFLLLCFSIPASITEHRTLYSCLFVILGIRRILTVQSGEQHTRKIFDSFFFLGIAALIHPPTIAFLFLPFFILLVYVPLEVKHLLIAIPTLASIWIMGSCYTLFKNDTLFNPFAHFNLNFHTIEGFQAIGDYKWSLFFVVIYFIYALTRLLPERPGEDLSEKKWRFIQFPLIIIALIVSLLTPSHDTIAPASFIFLFIPISITLGNYFSIPSRKRLKSYLFSIFILGCIFFGIDFYTGIIS